MKKKHSDMFMRIAQAAAETSSATRAKVGAAVVKDLRCIATGYNAQPAHIDRPCELPNGSTDPTVRHAEKNALMGLTRTHESSVGATMFCTLSCCESCAHDIVEAGIKEFVYLEEYRDTTGLEILRKAGIKVRKERNESD